MKQHLPIVAIVLLLTCILGAHLGQLDSIPAGFFLDETSIGLNAALIAQNGIDEHNIRFPVYFKAFGEYKNPIYIYATALIFRLFGISELNLRMTSFVFFSVALLMHFLLVTKLFKRSITIHVYALASFGFLPIFFILSRISFELISQLTWVTAINLLVWLSFHGEPSNTSKKLYSSLLGLAIGSSVYTYSTARILSLFAILLLWGIYFHKEAINKLLLTTVFTLISLIPYLLFSILNPGALTRRFFEISYIDDTISPASKIVIFAHNLSRYWSLDFLVEHGDGNLRHSTGHGGIVFLGVFILFLIGVIYFLFRSRPDRFNLFVLGNLFVSPFAAALTSEGTPHALRSLLLGYYIVLISCYGLDCVINLPARRPGRMVGLFLLSLLTIEITAYLLHYFFVYSVISAEAMGSFAFKNTLQAAINHEPQHIQFHNRPFESYANLQFYRYIIKNPRNIPLTLTQSPNPTSGSCVVYHRNDEYKLVGNLLPFQEYETTTHPNFLQQALRLQPAKGALKARCYH
jgi:hypothetical protein